jgi:hypothetical protein
VTTQGTAEVTTSPQGPGAPGVSVPGELLAAAAAVGAQDAGPGPSGAPAATGAVPPPPSATAGLLSPGARPSDLAAGAAPGTRAEPPPSVTTEDGE